MSITLIKCNVKVPFKCILAMCLEHPSLEELYEDTISKADATKEYDLRFEGEDYFRDIAHIIRQYDVTGDIVMHDDEYNWAYRFHDKVSDYVTWPNDVKYKLKSIKNDNN